MQYLALPIGCILLLLIFTPLGFWGSVVLGGILGIMMCVAPQTMVGIVICTLGYIAYMILTLIF
jgi:hypothetical protein